MKRITLILLLTLPLLIFGQSKEELINQINKQLDQVETIRLIQRVGGYNPDYKEMRVLFNKLDKKVQKTNEGKIFDRYLKNLKNV